MLCVVRALGAACCVAFAITALIVLWLLVPWRARSIMRSSTARLQRMQTDTKLEAIHLRKGVRDAMPGAY